MVPNTQTPPPPDTNEAPLAVPNYGKTRDEYAAENERLRATISRQSAAMAAAKAELEWYGEQTRLCRLIHSEGDTGRHALSENGGNRARAAVLAIDEALK